MKIKNKSQMEIMGLAVIVVLITIGIFFVVSFKAKEKKQEPLNTFASEQMATNFIIALLKTTVECNNQEYSFENLVKDCATEKNIKCSGGNSCSMIQTVAKEITDKTLVEWRYSFNLSVEKTGIEIINLNCTADREKGQQGFQPVPLYPMPGAAAVSLDICK